MGVPFTDSRLNDSRTVIVCAFVAPLVGLTRTHCPEKSGLSCADIAGATEQARMHDARSVRMVAFHSLDQENV
jgi:hypothetical protein